MAALRGTYLSITVEGDEYNTDVKSWNLTPAEANDNDVTFSEASGSATTEWNLGLTFIQDTGPDSLWTYMADHLGATAAVVLKPLNAAVSADNPAFNVTATVSLPAGSAYLGGDASKDRTRFTTEVTWACTTPVKDTTP